MRDLANRLHLQPAFAPKAAVAADAAQVSSICDLLGFGSAMLAMIHGTQTDADATVVVLLEEGDESDLSDAAAVADADLIGTEALAAFTFADDGECRKLGYVGSKRYIRATITPSGNTSGTLYLGGMWVLGNPAEVPTINPPA